jgi:hypothetical protein
VKTSWIKIGSSHGTVTVDVVAGGTVRVMLHVPNSEGAAVRTHDDGHNPVRATITGTATMGNGGRGAFVITGAANAGGETGVVTVYVTGFGQYDLDVNVVAP